MSKMKKENTTKEVNFSNTIPSFSISKYMRAQENVNFPSKTNKEKNNYAKK